VRNETEGLGRTVEDYLEAILRIKKEQGYVRSVDVAEMLGVKKPSVTYATKKLKEEGYITTDHAGMLVLTDEGKRIAEKTYGRHRTMTDFFERLGVSPEQAEKDACLIEHDLSDETYDALCRYIRNGKDKS
jgi:DtxR family Mn-dependent transcriptional regulator